MSEEPRREGMQTRLIHGADALNGATSVSPPIYQTSTYRLPDPERGAEIAAEVAPAEYYTRYGSPNNKQVERVLAELEGAEAALVVGSGMAAISTALLSNLRAGDHVVAQRTHYTAALTLLTEIAPGFGIETTLVDQEDTAAFERAIRPNTKVLYTETPTNPTLALTDLAATAKLAHDVGALAVTDNTFASSYNQRPLDLGYDLVVHSATKYLNGHADVTAGVVLGDAQLIERAWEHLRVFGPVLHPFESWLLLRGLRTYALRMRGHNANALEVARYLDAHPAVERVYYPGLESHPGHDLARRQMTGGFGAMMAFELRDGYDAARCLVGCTRLCTLAASLGSMESLITHAASMIFPHNSDEERLAAGVTPGLVRLSVGLEDLPDLIADLEQALGRAT